MSAAQGVPVNEATAKDFMMVRAALVKRLGGADNALVWARIYYRCDSDSRVAHEVDGQLWWQASHSRLADETGLSEKQARVAIGALVEGGFVERANHSGRVYSYRTVTYLPNRADSLSAQLGTSICPAGQMHLPSEAVTPLLRQEDVEDTPVVPKGTTAIDDAFDALWELWPAHRRGTRKKSGSSFRTAVRAVGGVSKIDVILSAARAHVEVWALWPKSELRFVPQMTTWLNQERWTGALPESRQGPRDAVAEAFDVYQEYARAEA